MQSAHKGITTLAWSMIKLATVKLKALLCLSIFIALLSSLHSSDKYEVTRRIKYIRGDCWDIIHAGKIWNDCYIIYIIIN